MAKLRLLILSILMLATVFTGTCLAATTTDIGQTSTGLAVISVVIPKSIRLAVGFDGINFKSNFKTKVILSSQKETYGAKTVVKTMDLDLATSDDTKLDSGSIYLIAPQ